MKIIHFLKGKFLLGILLGALSSIMVNSFAIEYEKFLTKKVIKESISSELTFNKGLINNSNKQNQIYIRDFRTDAWETSQESGYLYKFSPDTLNQLNNTFYEINRVNRIRNIEDEYVINLVSEADKNYGLSLFYETKSNEENNTELYNIAMNRLEDSVALLGAQEYMVDNNVKYAREDNERIILAIDSSLKLLEIERESNPLYLLIITLLILSGIICFYIVGIKHKSVRQNFTNFFVNKSLRKK